MQPKPIQDINFIWLSFLFLFVLINPLYLFGQEKTDSLKIYRVVGDSLKFYSSISDSLEQSVQKKSNLKVISDIVYEKIDSTINQDVEKLGISNKVADPIIDHTNLNRISSKEPDLGSKIKTIEINMPNSLQSIDVPKIQNFNLNNYSLRSLNERLVSSKLKIKQELDSLSFEDIEKRGEELAKNNIKELQELDKMEASANNVHSQMDNFKWDKSKINSSRNVAKVLSDNVEAVQTGMDKMKDLKAKYSKVNLMNPNGPVLQEISKKPVKPWQFSLNFSSQIQNGLTIQLAPTVGYKLNEKLVGGIGVSYQNKIVEANNSYAISPNQELSHRIFSQYNFYRNFFLHVEHELPYKQNMERKESSWYNLDAQKSKGWLGMALQYKVYKNIKGQTQILYNLIKPDNNSSDINRWTIRINLIMK